MNQTLPVTRRNQTLDCIRMLACSLVVFAHVPFPGAVGEWISCLFRFAVPFFFAVSGYFSFGVTAGKLTGRLVYLLKLNLFAIGISLLCELAAAWGSGGDPVYTLREAVPTVGQLAKWVFLHVNPFGGHLWYLTAAAVCYGIAALYTGFFGEEAPDYKMLYTAGFFLFLLRFAGADMLAFGDVKLPYWLFRDGTFLGFPMFAMGMFLKQYESRILSGYRLTAGKLQRESDDGLCGSAGPKSLLFRGAGSSGFHVVSLVRHGQSAMRQKDHHLRPGLYRGQVCLDGAAKSLL